MDEKTAIEVLEILEDIGGTDGGHHKQWGIDQAIRKIQGDNYDRWVESYESGEDGPKTYSWDVGIAP